MFQKLGGVEPGSAASHQQEVERALGAREDHEARERHADDARQGRRRKEYDAADERVGRVALLELLRRAPRAVEERTRREGEPVLKPNALWPGPDLLNIPWKGQDPSLEI